MLQNIILHPERSSVFSLIVLDNTILHQNVSYNMNRSFRPCFLARPLPLGLQEIDGYQIQSPNL